MIKKLLTLVLLMSYFFSNAQESQSIIAAKWKDGSYPWFHNNNSHNWTAKPEFEETDKAEIKITKNEKGEVTEIELNGKKYLTDNPEVSSYARYFRTTTDSGRCLFFTDDCIMVYVLGKDENPANMRYVASVGKAGSKKGYSEFVAHLEKSREIVKEEVAEFKETKTNNTIIGKHQDIKKIEAVVITKDGKELKSGDSFSLGFITTFKDDKVIKTKNIGGLHDIREYTYSVSFPIERSQNMYNVGTLLVDSMAPYCDYLNGEKMNVSIYTKGDRNNYSKYISDTTIEFNNCSPDPSPKVNLYRNVAEKYDALRLIYGNGGGEHDCNLEKHEPYGFLRQTNDNAKNFKFEEMKENDCFVVARKDSKYYFLTLDGKLKSEQAYEDFSTITDGRFHAKINDIQLYEVNKNGKYGILNYKLEVILPFEYDDILPAGTKNIIVVKDGKKGLMNLENLKKPSVYYDLLEGGVDFTQFRVRLNGKYGYLNDDGEVLMPIEYDYLGHNIYGIFPVHKDGKYYFLSMSSGVVMEDNYQMTGDFTSKQVDIKGKSVTRVYAKVKDKDGVEKYIDNYGYEVGDSYFEDVAGSDNTNTNTTTNSTSTNKNNSTKEVTTCTIVNDLSPEQQKAYGIKLVFGNYGKVTQSILRNKSIEVDCDDVKVYKEKKENSTEKGDFLFDTKGQCGQTFKLSDYY